MIDEYRRGYQDGRALYPQVHGDLESLKQAVRWYFGDEQAVEKLREWQTPEAQTLLKAVDALGI